MSDAREIASDFPYAASVAAEMLRHGLNTASAEHRRSLRSIAKELGYKQATVLSHMASGRVLVPLDRAREIALAVGIDPADLLMAAVEQRVEGARQILSRQKAQHAFVTGFVHDLADIASSDLDHLSDETKRIIREVVSDPLPTRRWLSLAELPAVMLLRRALPRLASEGLTSDDRERLENALNRRRVE